MTLDDKLFLLKKNKDLTPELRRQVTLADIAFLQDRDSEANSIVSNIEKDCQRMGIKIYLTDNPLYAILGI